VGAIRLGVDDIANLRFAVSPLWETVAGFQAALDPGRHAIHLPWLRKAVALLRDPVLARVTEPLRALPTMPPPRCPLAEFEEELAALRTQPLVAEAAFAWWEAAVKPFWPRIRAVLEADVSFRTRQLIDDGIQLVLADLHPSLVWADELLVSPDLPDDKLELGGAGLTLAPTAFGSQCHLATGDGSVMPALVYPTRAVGTLWESRDTDDALRRLLGRSRAQLLAQVASPTTTTQLAALTGLSLGAVSQHLSVLLDAGLVTRHRYRREVNYTASDLGISLLERA
jgi:DNA-binding transcriptional ArsR family regulator